MEQAERTMKMMAGITLPLLVILTVGTIYYWDKSNDLAREKNQMDAKANSLELTRNNLEKDNRHLGNRLDSAQKANQTLTVEVTEVNSLLSRKNARVSELQQRNTLLQSEGSSLQNQLEDVTRQFNRVSEEHQLAVTQNDELNHQVTVLNEQLQTMAPRKVLTADGFKVELLKRNDKLTAKAKKVDDLIISFNVPKEMGLQGIQEVFLTISDSQNNAFRPAERTEAIDAPGSNGMLPVHAAKTVDFSKNAQGITLSVEDIEKLKPGKYRAWAFTRHAYLGAVEFEVRDSFWFF